MRRSECFRVALVAIALTACSKGAAGPDAGHCPYPLADCEDGGWYGDCAPVPCSGSLSGAIERTLGACSGGNGYFEAAGEYWYLNVSADAGELSLRGSVARQVSSPGTYVTLSLSGADGGHFQSDPAADGGVTFAGDLTSFGQTGSGTCCAEGSTNHKDCQWHGHLKGPLYPVAPDGGLAGAPLLLDMTF